MQKEREQMGVFLREQELASLSVFGGNRPPLAHIRGLFQQTKLGSWYSIKSIPLFACLSNVLNPVSAAYTRLVNRFSTLDDLQIHPFWCLYHAPSGGGFR